MIRSRFHRLSLIALALLLSGQTASAQLDYGFDFSKSGTAGMQFLKIAVGARPAGMGEAATTLVQNVDAIYWNTGGLGYVTRPQLSVSHIDWLAGSRHDAVAVGIPVGRLVVGLSAVQFAIQEFEETTVENPLGTGRMVQAGDLMLGLAVSSRISDRLSLGGQVKFNRETLDQDSYSNLLFDIGTLYFTGFRDLRLGFTLQHFGPDIRIDLEDEATGESEPGMAFRMPLLFRMGASDNLIATKNHRLTTAIDLVHPTDNREWVNWGLEYEFMQAITIRTGYRFNVDEGRLAFGFGLRPPLKGLANLAFDFAYVDHGEIFGPRPRFSIRFGR